MKVWKKKSLLSRIASLWFSVLTYVQDVKGMAATMSSVTFRHISHLLNNSSHVLPHRVEHFGCYFFRKSFQDCIRSELCNVIG
jgi:hypothetical protein